MRKMSMLFLMAVAMILGLVGCNLNSSANEISEQDAYALTVFSMGELLGQSETVAIPEVQRLATTNEVEPIETDTDPVLEKYLTMMETYLNPNGPLQVITNVSDREGYAFMSSVLVKDMLGETVSYTIYFNETLIIDPIETDDDIEPEQNPEAQHGEVNPEHDELFEDASDSEVRYELEGLLIVDDIEYTIVGRKVIEEDETVLKLVAYTDRNNFIRMSYKTDGEDQKFDLVQRVDGQIAQRTSIKMMTEASTSVVMLTYQTETQVARYRFKQVENEDYDILIKYDIRQQGSFIERGMIKITINIDENTNLTSYTYQIIGERRGHSFEGNKGMGRGHHGQQRDDNEESRGGHGGMGFTR